MRQINVGIVGAGFVGKQHVEALRRIPGIKIVALADFNPAAKTWAKENDIPAYYEDYREMLENEELEVIHDCAPNHLHYKINLDSLRKGCHVYSEKPLTLTAKESKELMLLAEEKGLKAGVNFNYRNYVMVNEMRGRMLEGRYGLLSHIQGEYLQDWLLKEDDFDWRILSKTGGNSRTTGDIGSHCFDAIQYITGEKIKSVYADYFTLYPKRKKYLETSTFSEGTKEGRYEEIQVDTEDAATILFRLEGGMRGTFILSQICPGKKNGMRLLIGGNEESAEWEQEIPDRLLIGRRDRGNEVLYADRKYLTNYAKDRATLPNGHPVGWKDALTNAFLEFYESIRNPDKPYRYADFKEGYYVAKIVEACYESSKRKCWIDID